MEEHFKLNDHEFEQQFRDCILNPMLFSHEAHLRLAWIHLTRYGADVAIENLCTQIALFDQTHDDGTKYHKTLTIAAIKIVERSIENTKTNNFKEFIDNNPHLNTHFKELLQAHYSFDIINNIEAKKAYIEPDLIAF